MASMPHTKSVSVILLPKSRSPPLIEWMNDTDSGKSFTFFKFFYVYQIFYVYQLFYVYSNFFMSINFQSKPRFID
jgi:hypothetical protein